MIDWMLVTEPVMKPRRPNRVIRMHFTSVRLYFPILGQKVTISIMHGKMIARVEDATAPINEMKRPMLGISAANVNVNNTRKVRKLHSI